MPIPPRYQIIYNWDGAPHDYSEYPQSLEQFLDKTYAPIEDTQVGALCWCMGIHEATWPSERLDVVGDSVSLFLASPADGFSAVIVESGGFRVEVQFIPLQGDATSWVVCEVNDGVVCSSG